MPNRMEKIDEIVKREVARSLFELFPERIISVTLVQVSKDLSSAKIWITTLEYAEKTVKDCQRFSAEITRGLARKLSIRRVPKLIFIADKTAEKVNRVEELLNQIHTNDQK